MLIYPRLETYKRGKLYMTKKLLRLSLFTLPLTIMSIGLAHAEEFSVWKNSFRQQALSQGINAQVFDTAMAGINPIQKVISLDKKQPERKLTFAQYQNNVISQARINQGRALYRKHYPLLKEIEAKYGVQPQYVIALWGIETSYGNNTGGYDVVPALATLAWEGRRRDFFEDELINALRILQEGHIQQADFKGSWAGAMGQNQFMPSSFKAYAVDYTGDGRRDIWTTLPDVFASTSNYLAKSGWNAGERWGREVALSRNLDPSLADLKITKPLSEWARLGVTTRWGQPLPTEPNLSASLVQPDGPNGPSYLAYNNYKTIMKWNRSTYFATSVGILADAIVAQ